MGTYRLQFRDKKVDSVVQHGTGKFVQLSFHPGEGLTNHHTPFALTVIVLSGKVEFAIGEQREILESSDMFTVNPNVDHAIHAIEQSIVLLVLTSDPEANKPVQEEKSFLSLDHENVYQHPEIMDQIAVELKPLVADHLLVCKILENALRNLNPETIRAALLDLQEEIRHHFVLEEEILFPKVALHVGGGDVGPVARLTEEHADIRRLHAESLSILDASQTSPDQHVLQLLREKFTELTRALLNHLGKEDSHLFPMASRLLTDEEKKQIQDELAVHATN